jgi:hypothetical protein
VNLSWMPAALAALVTLAGCGSDDEDGGGEGATAPATAQQTQTAPQPTEPQAAPAAPEAEQVVRDYYAAQVLLDGEEACGYLTSRLRKKIPELLAPAMARDPRNCVDGYNRFAKRGIIVEDRELNTDGDAQALELASELEAGGKKATVRPDEFTTLELIKVGGEWKIDDETFD